MITGNLSRRFIQRRFYHKLATLLLVSSVFLAATLCHHDLFGNMGTLAAIRRTDERSGWHWACLWRRHDDSIHTNPILYSDVRYRHSSVSLLVPRQIDSSTLGAALWLSHRHDQTLYELPCASGEWTQHGKFVECRGVDELFPLSFIYIELLRR